MIETINQPATSSEDTVRFIPYADMNTSDKESMQKLIEMSISLGDYPELILERPLDLATLFVLNDEPVGYNIRRTQKEINRVGPIFVIPEMRKRGIASQFLMTLPTDMSFHAIISDSNIASRSTFMSAGFFCIGRGRSHTDEDPSNVFAKYKKHIVPPSLL